MAKHGLGTVGEIAKLIESKRVLLLAGDEALLSALPAGTWIGGTSANFMVATGGTTNREQIFYTDVTDFSVKAEVRTYTVEELRGIGKNYPSNGFTVLIVPGMSAIHGAFAKEVQTYEDVFQAPLVGWVSGVHVSEIGKRAPKSFAGSGAALENKAAVLHITLPDTLNAHLDIINLFTQGHDAEIEFDVDSFGTEGHCRINGTPSNLAAYVTEKNIDTKLPLVADYNGAMINVSIQSVDEKAGKVQFYAPVFQGIKYRFAAPVADYTGEFAKALSATKLGSVAFSCNCILNYLYADLEGKKTGSLVGPITFGEIAYMLLNQTLVYLSIEKVD